MPAVHTAVCVCVLALRNQPRGLESIDAGVPEPLVQLHPLCLLSSQLFGCTTGVHYGCPETLKRTDLTETKYLM